MEEHPNIFDSSYAPSTKKSKKKPRDPDRAARPPNSWILYRAQKSKEISDQQKQREKDGTAGDRLRQTDVSRIISLAWQTESEEVKEKFAEMARKHKAEVSRRDLVMETQEMEDGSGQLWLDGLGRNLFGSPPFYHLTKKLHLSLFPILWNPSILENWCAVDSSA